MPRCATCEKLTRATRYCSYFKVYLKPNEIHRGGKCDGYKWKGVEVVA
jgi:hypothetical protein